MHTIKPTTLPFNPEHHIALEVEITYPIHYMDRHGTQIIDSGKKTRLHKVNIIQGDMYFLFEGMGDGCAIETIPDTKEALMTGITNYPADHKGVVRAKVEYEFPAERIKTDRPAEWEKWYVTGG